jgi:hypothetical protein
MCPARPSALADDFTRANMAVSLPEKSPIVDLHSDTALHNRDLNAPKPQGAVMTMFDRVTNLFSPEFNHQLTRDTLDVWGSGAQVFSIVTQGFPPAFDASFKLYSWAAGRSSEANATGFNSFLDQAAWTYRQAALNPERLEVPTAQRSTQDILCDGRVAAHIGIEGATFLIPHREDWKEFQSYLAKHPLPAGMPVPTRMEVASLEGRVRYLKRLGVLYVGLNHLDASPFSGSDLGFSREFGAGLSPLGRKMVKLLNDEGILVDGAHASHQTQKDLIGLTSLPLIVSHGVVPTKGREANWRELIESTLDEVKRTGGLVGVMFAKVHLDHGTVSDVVDQMDIIKARIGVEHIGFGSDADGFVGLAIGDMGHVEAVVKELRRRGYTEAEIQGIRSGNFLRVLQTRDRLMKEKESSQASAKGV